MSLLSDGFVGSRAFRVFRGSATEQVDSILPGARLPASVVGGDLEVPLVSGERVRYVNLDYAATTPCLTEVHAAVEELLPWYGSVHRGAGFVSSMTTDAFAAARAEVGAFVGARVDDVVIFTRNTTDALNLLASALPPDTEVITFASEHHANMLPWRRCVSHTQLAVPRSREDAIAALTGALRRSASAHKLVAVTGASNVTGELWPLEELAAIAHAHGARIAVDAAQLAPHRAVRMAALGIDYVALSGHKLYAPFGAGALIGRSDWLDAAPPYLAGGGAVSHVGIDSVDWTHGPSRHEAGTPNVVGAIALGAACRALRASGYDEIARHERALFERLRDGLARIEGIDVFSLWGDESADARIGVVTFNLAGWHHGALAAALNAEHGIGVRDGAFCAHPLIEALTKDPSARGAVRASIGAGSRSADIERLLFALNELRRYGARWGYRLDRGRFTPEPDPRPRPQLRFA